MTILLLFSFLAGFVTILAPCIWPLLPIVLSASTVGGKSRPLGITLGVMTSFTVFTLTISYLEKIFHVDPNHFRLAAVMVIVLMGLAMIVPSLGTWFENFINRVLSPLHHRLKREGTGFGAGYAAGFSIGLVWAPCAGPILATIATLAATQSVNVKVVLVTLAYVCGLGVPLFFISLAGSWCFSRMRLVSKYTGRIQQVFGVVMLVAAVLIYTNYDKTIQLKILQVFPSYGNFLSQIENNEQIRQELSSLRGEPKTAASVAEDTSQLPDLGPAPELAGISRWLNSDPLTLAQLRGKVVLIDFWTYSCINCVRTLPHVTGWYEKYKDKNFVVIGVHTPEFAFEKNTANVQNALGQFKISFPVAQDNDYRTWRAFENHYWPAKYLIDVNGRIRYTHFGEGRYAQTESAIRALLQEAGNRLDADGSFLQDQTPAHKRTPETYLGRARMKNFASPQQGAGGRQEFTVPDVLPLHHFAYAGTWEVGLPSAQGQTGSTLEINFQADKVFLVISPRIPGDRIRIFLDGRPVDDTNSGADVAGGVVTLDTERLYHLIDLQKEIKPHRLRLELQSDGIAVYAFTFG